MKISGEEDEDNVEELYNCKFTLTYGTKNLLHNTKVRLLHEKKYNLLDRNNSGKTTPMGATPWRPSWIPTTSGPSSWRPASRGSNPT